VTGHRRLAGLLVLLATAVATGHPASALATAGPPATTTTTPAHLVVVDAVPDLRWSDVDVMPTLLALTARSAVGEMVVKTTGDTTRCAAGSLAVGAGNRSDSAAEGCAVPAASWSAVRARNRSSEYAADVGALGDALRSRGIPTVAVGQDAVPLLADSARRVTATVPSVADALARTRPAGGVVALVDESIYRARAGDRRRAASSVDGRLGSLLAALPAGATLVVAGTSDGPVGGPHLHVVVVTGPSWRHRELVSAAGRPPYVQLFDVRAPAGMAGAPMRTSGAVARAPSSYADDDRHATAAGPLGHWLFAGLCWVSVAMMLLLASDRRWTRPLALVVAPLPVMAILANALPWWRWGDAAYVGLVLAGSLLVTGLTAAVRSRRGWPAAAVAVPLLTVLVVGTDQLAGSPLQLSGPLGNDPLLAGRFRGVGNLEFAVLAASSLLLAGLVAGRLAGRRARVAAAGAVLLLAVVVDGAPGLGDDIGGVVSLLPAAGVLLVMLAGVRLSWRRIVAVVGVTVAVVVVIALADYARPAADQTHIGHFVGQLLHGGSSTVVRRKLHAMLASIGGTVATVVVVAAVVLATVCRRRLGRALDRTPGLRAAAVAVTVVAVLGSVLNDSGITVAAMAVVVALPVTASAIPPQRPRGADLS
jgi:hypothetical protein